MEIILVRHGQTEGNKIHRFIGGRTDEPVSREGMEALKKRTYPQPEHIFSSPMLRCVQTAQSIFRGRSPEVVEGFRECDFGILEGKTHEELLGDPAYAAFIAPQVADTFPGGESIPGFNARCLEALRETVEISRKRGYGSIACCVHGGVIMAVLSQVIEGSSYYGWNVENGEGYILEIDENKWKDGQLDGTVTGGIDHRIYS